MDRIDLNKFVQQIREVFKESKLTWRYEQVSPCESVVHLISCFGFLIEIILNDYDDNPSVLTMKQVANTELKFITLPLQLSWKEYQRDKKNNRELATLLDFHCNYAPLRDVRTMQALNPHVQTFSEYVSANQKRLTKLFKLVNTT